MMYVLIQSKNKVSTLELKGECFLMFLTSNSPTLLPPPEPNWATCLGRPSGQELGGLSLEGARGSTQHSPLDTGLGERGRPLNQKQPCNSGPFSPSLVLPQTRSPDWVGGSDPAPSRPACPQSPSSPERPDSQLGLWVHGRHRPHAVARPARVSPPQPVLAQSAPLWHQVPPASSLSRLFFFRI